MAPTFKPLQPRETSVEACERALRAAILRGEFQPGDRLPPERELAERFGVNRVTVRNALGRVNAARLTRTRQGSGHVVCDFLRDGGPDLLPGLVAEQADAGARAGFVRDLLRVRRHLARAVLETFVERAARGAPSDLRGVAAAVARFEAIATHDPKTDRLAEADVEVLAALLEASESAVLRLCLNPVVSVLRDLPALRAAIYATPARNVEGWRALLAWLEAPEPSGLELLVAFLERDDELTAARVAVALGAAGDDAPPTPPEVSP